jgi:hypothetical protein
LQKICADPRWEGIEVDASLSSRRSMYEGGSMRKTYAGKLSMKTYYRRWTLVQKGQASWVTRYMTLEELERMPL